jgi:hypothetical protein
MPPTSADTATAPRIRQYEQVHRRAVLNPSVNFTRKRTVPQWHTASISRVSFACIVKLPSFAEDSCDASVLGHYVSFCQLQTFRRMRLCRRGANSRPEQVQQRTTTSRHFEPAVYR